jgi:hypothetical protein
MDNKVHAYQKYEKMMRRDSSEKEMPCCGSVHMKINVFSGFREAFMRSYPLTPASAK